MKITVTVDTAGSTAAVKAGLKKIVEAVRKATGITVSVEKAGTEADAAQEQ